MALTGRRTVAARGGAACGLLGPQREAHGEEGRGDTSTPQEDVDALRGPERRRLQKRTDLAIPHSPCDMPDDEVETCDGVRVWELPC
jgi:hypothetical protein